MKMQICHDTKINMRGMGEIAHHNKRPHKHRIPIKFSHQTEGSPCHSCFSCFDARMVFSSASMKTTLLQGSYVSMLTIIYDGACPFCSHYVLKQQIEAAHGPLILLDARSGDERLLPYWQQGHALDEGMLIDHHGEIAFGDAALSQLAALSQQAGPFARVNRLLSHQSVSRFFYPIFKIVRRMALWVRGYGPLRHPPMTKAMKHKAG